MGPHIPPAPGTHFNRWEILGFAWKRVGVLNGRRFSRYYYRARCECGNERVVVISSLRAGQSTQCCSCAGRTHPPKPARPIDHGARYAQLYFTSRMFNSGLDLDRLIWEASESKERAGEVRSLSV